MPVNRRNYYRLLHVQSDAPHEVIKAAYRALISGHHPDHGGDNEDAALLNEAYHVLCDPVQRGEYDAMRAARSGRVAGKGSAAGPGRIPPDESAARVAMTSHCSLCHLVLPASVQPSSRCTRCHAPLAPALHMTVGPKGFERRSVPRVNKSDWALLYLHWPAEVVDVRMRDLSMDGISVYSGTEVSVPHVIRVVGASFEVVADLVSCRRVAKVYTLHGRLLTAMFNDQSGGFASPEAAAAAATPY